MSCQEIIGCVTAYKNILPICSRNCELNATDRKEFVYLNNQKKILNLVGTSSSQYQSKLATMNVLGQRNCACVAVWKQGSDRTEAGQPTAYVPRRRMSSRPGGTGTGGKSAIGVDIKHGSYARFLASKRGML